MVPRILEPEVMDSVEEAVDYNSMDHRQVNRLFVDDLLAALERNNMTESRGLQIPDPWDGLDGQLSDHPETSVAGLPQPKRLSKPSDKMRARRAHVVMEDSNTLGPPLSILDVGTGTALIPIELCRRPVACRVTAIDLAAEMLKVAEENITAAGLKDSITLEPADSKKLPYPHAHFPVVISNSLVHHIPEPKTVLAEMLRVLRPGGVLFVRDLLRPDDIEMLDRLVETYAGDAHAHQKQMFRDSLHAALTLAEIQYLLGGLGLPAGWAAQTSDRHWTIDGARP